MNAIGWVDADTFYCNAERARYPMLRGVPLGVLGNNGACVIARTPEMKKAGISVGDPVWEAKVRCPDGVFLKRDFDWIGDVSGRMIVELRELSPLAEYFSIDEMGFEALPLKGSYARMAETVRGRGRLPEDSAFLEKPFHQLALLRAIRALITQPRSRNEAR